MTRGPHHRIALIPCVFALACGNDARDAARGLETWVAVEDLRIGSADDPELAFSWVSGIQVGEDGTIYSLHPNDQMVRRFSAAGKPLGTMGRRGGGPGEFANPLTIGWLGDTLWVYDAAVYRFSLFTPTGGFIRTLAPRVLAEQHRGDRPARPSEVLPDGTLLGGTPMSTTLITRGIITTRPVLRLNDQGALLDTIMVLPVSPNAVLTISSGQGALVARQPFSSEPLRATSAADSSVVIVEREPTQEESKSFRIIKLSLDGDTILLKDVPYVPRSLSTAVVDSVVEYWAVQAMASRGARAPTLALAREVVRKALYLPPHQPPVRALMVGSDGTIWLQRELEPGPARWEILDAGANPLASVYLPSDLRLWAATADAVYGTMNGALDVPQIVRFRLKR